MSALGILMPAIKSTITLFDGELSESEFDSQCRELFEWICRRVKSTGYPVKRKEILQSKKIKGGF